MNTNFLKGMRCTNCGNTGPFYITCSVNYEVYDSGPDESSFNKIRMEEDSPCSCLECGYMSTVGGFKIPGPSITEMKSIIEEASGLLTAYHIHDDGPHREICVCPEDCPTAALINKMKDLLK